MAGRFEFESPGAAFVDQMTKVLAQRKVEERQAMLDNLTKAADARAADEAKQMALYRADQMKSNAQSRDIEHVNAVTAGMSMGDKTTGMSPETIDLMRRYKRLKERPLVPSVSSSTDYNVTDDTGVKGEAIESDIPAPEMVATPPPPPEEVFVGTREERDKAARIAKGKAALGVLATNGDPEDLKAAEYLSLLAEVNDGDIPKEAYTVLTPKQQAKIFNTETGETRLSMLEGGAPNMTRGETILQQRPDTTHSRERWPVGKTRDGFTIYVDAGGKETIGTNKSGPDPGELPFRIPIGLSNAHRDSFIGMLAEPDDPAGVATFRKAGMDMLGSAQGVSSKVKMLIRTALYDPANLQDVYGRNELTPSEAEDFTALLTTVIPPEAKPLLLLNAPKRKVIPSTSGSSSSTRSYGPAVVPVVKPQPSDATLGRIK